VLPLLALVTTCCLQALLLALGIVFSQVSADRAARGEPRAQAVESIPAGWRRQARITRSGDRVQVRLRVPALVPGTGRWMQVSATSEAAS
jgi:hypothetical protein